MSDKNNQSNNDSGINSKSTSAGESYEEYRLRMEKEERDRAADLEGPMERAWRAEQGGHAALPATGYHSDKQGPDSQTANRIKNHESNFYVQDLDLVDPYIAALDKYTGLWLGPVPDTSGRKLFQYQGAGETDGTLRGGNTK